MGGRDAYLAVGENAGDNLRYEQWDDTGELGFTRLGQDSWENTTNRVRADVTSYTAGINAYLAMKPKFPTGSFRKLPIGLII